MKTFLTTIFPLLFLAAFYLLGLPVTGLAQSAEFQWAPTNHGIQVNAQEDGEGFLYNLQLQNQSEEIIIDETNSNGNFFIQNSNITKGEVYELSLSLNNEDTGEEVASQTQDVAVPDITVNSRCIDDFAGGTVNFIVDMTPGVSFFPNLSGEEVTAYETGSKRNAVAGLPYEHIQAQPGWTYRFVISFSSSEITLDSGDVTQSCEDEEVEVNFGYEVDGSKVDAFVLSPTEGQYGYGWDTDGDGDIDLGGGSLSETFDTQGKVSLTFIVTQGGSVIGTQNHSFLVPGNHKDLDGDGNPDGEEDEDNDAPDRDVDGIPDADDACPDDPTNTCDKDISEFSGAPEGGLVNCTNDCDWEDFLDLIDRLIVWMIGFATVVATLLFMYAGFLYLTAGGNEGQVDQAKGILANTAIGFGVILLAWLIVSTVVTLLTTDDWRDKNEEFLPIEFSYELEEDRLQL